MQVMNSIAGDAMPPEGTSFKSSSAPALHKLWVQYHAHNHQWHCPYQLTIVRHILQAMEMCQYFVLNHLGVRLIRCMLYALRHGYHRFKKQTELLPTLNRLLVLRKVLSPESSYKPEGSLYITPVCNSKQPDSWIVNVQMHP